jgi:hypothetical protein
MVTYGESELFRDDGKGNDVCHSLQLEAHWLWVQDEGWSSASGFVLDYMEATDEDGKEFDLTDDEEAELARSIYPEGGAE